MSEPKRVRVVLENLSTTTKSISLEPFGDHVKAPPNTTVHATWDFPGRGEAVLEISISNDGLTVWDASDPMHELNPDRDAYGGHLWE